MRDFGYQHIQVSRLELRQCVDMLMILPLQTSHQRHMILSFRQDQLQKLFVRHVAIFLRQELCQFPNFVLTQAQLTSKFVINDCEEFCIRNQTAMFRIHFIELQTQVDDFLYQHRLNLVACSANFGGSNRKLIHFEWHLRNAERLEVEIEMTIIEKQIKI